MLITFQEYKNKVEEKQQKKQQKKMTDTTPIKMGRAEKRKYLKHYAKQGVPRDEILKIIAMRESQSSFNFNNNIDLKDIEAKVKSGELPSNTLDIITGEN